MVPVASRVTKAWPAGQPEPMALMPMILTSWAVGAVGTAMAGEGAATAAPAKRAAAVAKRILNDLLVKAGGWSGEEVLK